MAKTLGYMITWTTYGTWLQGDERGYVKNAKIYPANKALMQANTQLQSQDAVRLSKSQLQLVKQAILNQSKLLGQQIYALAVRPTHVHLVAEYIAKPISKVVAYYKKSARISLKNAGYNGKVWTRGYDKRFCFDHATLNKRIKYVKLHNTALTTPYKTWGFSLWLLGVKSI